MRYFLLILLGLSLPAMAQSTTNSSNLSQEKPKPPVEGEDDIVESMTVCDPNEETRMRETFN